MIRNKNIDLIKCIAYIGVILLHVTGNMFLKDNSGPVMGQAMYYLGTIAVPLFFITNGYLLFGEKIRSYKYIRNKILELILVIFGWNLVYSAIYLSVRHVIKNPFLLTGESLIQRGFFFQFWFIGALMICYFMLPILNYLWQKHYKVLIVLFCMCLLFSVILDIRNLSVGGLPIQIHIIQTFRLWTWFLYYILGGIFKKLNIKNKLPLIHPVYTVILLIMMIVYEYIVKIRYTTGYAEYNYDNLLVILTVAALFATIINIKINVRWNKYILFVSKNGFGVYIIHIIFLEIISRILDLSNIYLNIVAIVFVLAGSYGVSYVLSKIPYVKKLVLR